jgi:hypothetical protein
MKSYYRLLLLITVLSLGIASRRCPIGFFLWDKSTGDLCYAAGVYLLIEIISPKLPPKFVAASALCFCIAIECFKLTGLPMQWDRHFILRILFGTRFSIANLLCYLLSILVMYLCEVRIDSVARPRQP